MDGDVFGFSYHLHQIEENFRRGWCFNTQITPLPCTELSLILRICVISITFTHISNHTQFTLLRKQINVIKGICENFSSFFTPEAENILTLKKGFQVEDKSMNLFNDEGMLIKCKWEGGIDSLICGWFIKILLIRFEYYITWYVSGWMRCWTRIGDCSSGVKALFSMGVWPFDMGFVNFFLVNFQFIRAVQIFFIQISILNLFVLFLTSPKKNPLQKV